MNDQAPVHRRRRTTSRRVYVMDRLASGVITMGGLIVVAAVLGIGVYLVSVVVDLFRPGVVESRFVVEIDADAGTLMLAPDEHQTALLRLLADGRLQTLELETGDVVDERVVTEPGRTITAFTRAARDGNVAIGYDDGSVQIGTIGFQTEFLLSDDEPEELLTLPIGQVRKYETGVVRRTPVGQLRLTRASVELANPARLRDGEGAVLLIDSLISPRAQYVVAVRADGAVLFNEIRTKKSLMGGPPKIRLRSHTLPAETEAGRGLPAWVFVIDSGASVVLIWPDGKGQRIDTSDPAHAVAAETISVVDSGRHVTVARKLLGSNTIIIGDDAGNVYGYFTARSESADTPDQRLLVRGHTHKPQHAAITAIGISSRDRSFITGDADGAVVVRNMTSEAVVATLHDQGNSPIEHAMLTPKMDGVLIVDAESRMQGWSLDPRHPEATLSSLFGKVWYEGAPAPSYTYQSSSGDDAAEAKFSLTPLVFGTIKATVYTMLISIPLGILAAIYTSEFLSPKLRATIKPSIEMMASLPSVVLGFIAAMVLAPIVAERLPGVLLAFVGVPMGVLLAAHLWHFAPVRLLSRTTAGGRLAMIVGVTVLAGWASIALGPAIESALFVPSQADVLMRAGSYAPATNEQLPDWVKNKTELGAREARRLRASGLYLRDNTIVGPVGSVDDPAIRHEIDRHDLEKADLRAWLDGVIGGAWPGWLLLAFPASALLVSILISRFINPTLRTLDRSFSLPAEATVEMVKLLIAIAACLALSALAATVLTAIGMDPRDSLFGVFQQRNTLIVGVVMGVAVIPIIYTLTDDAMASVPDTLRSASLGAGATRWQTAVRVVLPVAMSGVFSACMIGLGRAVGETMIVLMATGNTPIMSWSMFDGLRTLSANIAVELPEAPMNSTHYRVLFLCGLTLFLATFLINSAAEVIRQRVRQRNAAL